MTEEKENEVSYMVGRKEHQKNELKDQLLTVSTNPHITDSVNVSQVMWFVVIALLPATIAGIVFFKLNALMIIFISVLSAFLTEYLILKLRKKRFYFDASCIITGLLVGLIIPPTVPLWLPVIGSFFAIAIGKQIFGGLGHNIFNPALVGRAFLSGAFSALMTRYISPDGVTGATPLAAYKFEGIKAPYLDLFMGNIGGSIGETSALALLIGAAFLFYKKVIDWRIPLMYLASAALFAILFRQDPLFHLLSGGLMIGAFFMATDYVTSPVTKNGRIVFGIGCGFLAIILRLFSTYPEGVMFSILLMNAASPLIDRFTKPKSFGAK